MKQSKLAILGHMLSVRRARIEEERTPIAILTKKLEKEARASENLNQRLQAEMLDAEYWEALRAPSQPEITSVTTIRKSKRSSGVSRLAHLVTSLFSL